MILKDFTVLYVEDSKTLRQFMKDLLQDHVKDVYLAKDGKEGILQYSKLKPDIIISDINMPNIDGLQMSQIIKKIDKTQTIILLTAFEDITNLKKAIELGIRSFISKPIQNDEVIGILESTAKEIQNATDAEKLKKLEFNKEKIDLLLKLIKEIGHHWRQPLSSALAISSSFELKKSHNIYKNQQDEIDDINKISTYIKDLADILKQIEEIDFENLSMEDIENIIKISDPIYE